MSLNPSDFQIPPPENEEQFESLCLDLYKSEFGDQTQRNGRRGQSQDGVDIFVQDQQIGIQCKKKDLNDKIKKSELKEEVKKAKNFKPPLKRYILATTCKRDAEIQKVARLISENHKNQNLFSIEIHSWYEIKEFLDKHSEVYEKYYPSSQKAPSINSAIISSIQSESHHQELNRIRDLINEDKPKAALKLLENFKKEKWNQLENKEKYKVLTNMAWAKIKMRQETQASELLIEALQFNKEDENANENCALAYLIINDIKNTKKYIEKTKQLNPLNTTAYTLEVQIKDKENQSLNDIVSSIPQNIRTKHQIAHILSHISIKRKQYKEAEKWLNIFYDIIEQKNGNWKDINSEIAYADMSLGLILAKQDIFSGRHIPDNLKDKLEEIIKIYKKLITDSQYSELKDFNPNWYLHYALALELKGKLNDAICILQEGIRKFSYDDHLKIELSRLFTRKGDITQSISILEKLIGLQSLESNDFPDSMSKISLTSDKIDISEKLFTLALILTDLYFQNQQSEKAQKLLNKIKEALPISEDDRLEVNQYSIFRLINFGKIDKAEEILNPLFAEESNNIFNLILKAKIEEAKEKISETEKESVDHKNKKTQYLKRAYTTFKDKQYNNDELNQNHSFFKKKEQLRDIEQLSKELYYCKMFIEAEPLLEEITNKNLNHPDIFKLLHIYFENGKNKLAIELAEDLIKKFPDRVEPANILFLIYESLGNKQKAIQCYENFFKSNPTNDLIRIELAYTYTYSEHVSKAKELLKKDFNLNPLSSEQMSKLSLAYMKTGNIKKALETQYQCIKKNPGKMEPQSVYFELITFLNHQNLYEIHNQDKSSNILNSVETKLDKSFLHPEKLDIDCYVQIKDAEDLDETDIIIEEDADIYTPDHELSKALLGKKKKEVVLFQDKKYQIIKIQSKYIRKYQEIIKETENRYPSKPFVKSFSIPHNADIKELAHIFKKVQPNILKQYETLDQLFDFYNEGKATIGSIAKILSKHSIEIIREFITSKKYKLISDVPEWSDCRNTQEILDNKSKIVIDISSLITIHWLKMEKYIEKSSFKIYVCQSTIDSLKEYIKETALHSKDGCLTVGFDREGSLRKSFISSEVIKENLNFWVKVKLWVENYCSIKFLSKDNILSRKEKIEKENILGKEFFDSLLVVDNNSIFLCEDTFLRRFAKLKYSISGMRLFDLIEYFENKVIIDNNQAVKFKAKLVQLNHTYIPIDHNILLFLLKESEYSVNDIGFQRGLFFLGPISDLSGVVNIVANFLIEICQVPSLLPYSKQIITKKLLDKVSLGRNENPKTIANQVFHLVQIRTKLLPFLQNEIHGYIIEWLKGKIY
ncbi:MAG: hypothetical protein OXM55_06555 [Bdellovibrionales bacterium]|nr:hypothetical protein [Bdellovibrionales bacterium]